jgi:hypothetical protein
VGLSDTGPTSTDEAGTPLSKSSSLAAYTGEDFWLRTACGAFGFPRRGHDNAFLLVVEIKKG